MLKRINFPYFEGFFESFWKRVRNKFILRLKWVDIDIPTAQALSALDIQGFVTNSIPDKRNSFNGFEISWFLRNRSLGAAKTQKHEALSSICFLVNKCFSSEIGMIPVVSVEVQKTNNCEQDGQE